MTKLDAGLMTSLPASDSGNAAVWSSKRINPRPQSCLCLAWSGCPSNDDDDNEFTVLPTACLLRYGYKLFQGLQIFPLWHIFTIPYKLAEGQNLVHGESARMKFALCILKLRFDYFKASLFQALSIDLSRKI